MKHATAISHSPSAILHQPSAILCALCASVVNIRPFVVLMAVKPIVVGVGAAEVGSPLLEPERNAGSLALVAQGPGPGGVHHARLAAGLAAADYPVDFMG